MSAKKKTAKKTTTKKELIVDAPPTEEITTEEFLVEIPAEEDVNEMLVEEELAEAASVEVIVPVTSNEMSDLAPMPNPRQSRKMEREKVVSANIGLDNLNTKQQKTLLGNLSKRTLIARMKKNA